MRTFFETIFGKSGKSEKSDILHFVFTRNIIEKNDTESGIINVLELADGVKFIPISLSKKPEIVSIHRGMAKAVQDLKLYFNNPGIVYSHLSKAKELGYFVSVLHTDEQGKSFLYGENLGLKVAEISNEFVMLEGEEADVFYRVDAELAEKLTA